MATAALKKGRLEARCTSEQSEIIEVAVAISGRSKTDFIVAAVQEAAMKTIQDHQTMKLNQKDSVMFATALLNPPEPNVKLREAAERYNATSS